MKIETVKVQNYRNLDGIEIALHEEVNFIIGENNLGKSNFLDLLDTIFNGTKFSQSDFANNDKPIIVDISLKVTEEESSALGLEGKKDIVKIKVIQNSPDDRIELKDESCDKDLKYMGIRLANFIKYDPLRIPKDELNFYRNRGVGRFLSYIVQKVIDNKAVKVDDVFNQNVLNNLINTMNEYFDKIEHFDRYGIKASKDKEIKLEDIISEAVILKDSTDINITDAGAGLQFVILIILSILDKVKKIADRDEGSDNQKRDISMIVALDEPEIHLNPYLQRSLVKYLRRILNNEDSKFNELLKELFGIHSIKGQLIIVTHSPGVLLNDYKHYIRFYLNNQENQEKNCPAR